MQRNSLDHSIFGFTAPEESPGFLLWQTTITWQRLIKKVLDPYAITHPQFVLMALLLWLEEQARETTQGMLVQLSKLDKMTVSVSLRHLNNRGYIGRQESKADTRAKKVSLSLEGKTLISQLIPLVEKLDEGFFTPLSPEDRSRFENMLRRIIS